MRGQDRCVIRRGVGGDRVHHRVRRRHHVEDLVAVDVAPAAVGTHSGGEIDQRWALSAVAGHHRDPLHAKLGQTRPPLRAPFRRSRPRSRGRTRVPSAPVTPSMSVLSARHPLPDRTSVLAEPTSSARAVRSSANLQRREFAGHRHRYADPLGPEIAYQGGQLIGGALDPLIGPAVQAERAIRGKV